MQQECVLTKEKFIKNIGNTCIMYLYDIGFLGVGSLIALLLRSQKDRKRIWKESYKRVSKNYEKLCYYENLWILSEF